MIRTVLLYVFAPIGVVASCMFVVGLLKTAFSTQPVDRVEEVLEELSQKRGKRK